MGTIRYTSGVSGTSNDGAVGKMVDTVESPHSDLIDEIKKYMDNQQSTINHILAKIKNLKEENTELHTSVKELETQVTNANHVVKDVGVLKMDIEMVEQFESQLYIL